MASGTLSYIPLQDPALQKRLRKWALRAMPSVWLIKLLSAHHSDRVAALEEMPDEALADDQVAEALAADPTITVRIAFCRQIGLRRMTQHIAKLREMRDHPHGNVRRASLRALVLLDRKHAQRAGLQAMRSLNPEVRFEALDFLAEQGLIVRQGGKTAKPLLLALGDSRPEIRARAGLWLSTIANPSMLGWLEQALNKTPGPSPWWIAITAADLGSNAVFNFLLEPLSASEHSGALPCALALSRRRDPDTAHFLMNHWQQIQPRWHAYLCGPIGAMRDNLQALQFLLSLIQSEAICNTYPALPEVPVSVIYWLESSCNLQCPSIIGDSHIPNVVMGSEMKTALAAARVFHGWTSEAAMRSLLNLRLGNDLNCARLAGYALQLGGPWHGPLPASILDHLAQRSIRGLQAWWEACRHESAHFVRDLAAWRRPTLPLGEWEDQTKTGLYVALQAPNLPVIEELLHTNPWLFEELPAQLLGLADSNSWCLLERLATQPALKPSFLLCRHSLAKCALRKLQPSFFQACENMLPSESFDWINDELPELFRQLVDQPYGSANWTLLDQFTQSLSIAKLLPHYKDMLLCASLRSGNAVRLQWVLTIDPSRYTAIRPSSFRQMLIELAGCSPHATLGTRHRCNTWNAIEELAAVPFLRPYFLDCRDDLIISALRQGRLSCFDWLVAQCPEEPVLWDHFVWAILDHLIAVPNETFYTHSYEGTTTVSDFVTIDFLIHQLSAQPELDTALDCWLARALNHALTTENINLLRFLESPVKQRKYRILSALKQPIRTPERVITALHSGRYDEALWLLKLFGTTFIWRLGEKRQFAAIVARGLARHVAISLRHKYGWTLLKLKGTLLDDDS